MSGLPRLTPDLAAKGFATAQDFIARFGLPEKVGVVVVTSRQAAAWQPNLRLGVWPAGTFAVDVGARCIYCMHLGSWALVWKEAEAT